MCVVHTVMYGGCGHVHSYTEIVHENAIYCANQQVIHDGLSREQDKCAVCVKKDQELLCSIADNAGTRRGQSNEAIGGEQREKVEDLESQTGTESIVTEGLDFVKNHFGEGKGTETQDLGSSFGSGLADSRLEWQIVHEADAHGHEVAGVEDEVVVFGYGKEVNEVLDVDCKDEWMTQGQILPRTIAGGDWPSEDGNGMGLGRGGGARTRSSL